MIREIITPEQQDISIHLPQNFVGKKVEVVAFILDEVKEEQALNEETSFYLASEKVLAKDWLTPEEDKVWQDL